MDIYYLLNFSLKELPEYYTDVLVIGSGIAGLVAALEISKEYDVTLVTKGKLKDSSTWYAQGGIAAAIRKEDSPALHKKDTLIAGAGLCNPKAVDVLTAEGPDYIGELIKLGAEFDWAGERIRLRKEGGHSFARILHSGDATGREVEAALIRAAKTWRTIDLKEHAFAVDLVTAGNFCKGALVYEKNNGEIVFYRARATILATGGAGELYSVTTNPPTATGDGMAMAYRAGAVLQDMEFIQFHPTAFYEEEKPRFLITEALRGEGAYLRDINGRRFMQGRHPLAELAPRDVVAREMVKVMEERGADYIYLDARHLPEKTLKEGFPTVWDYCLKKGFKLSSDLIPVAPAAHYTIGGVKTDLWGRTSIRGLYASGEVASTGVHGANRLASNSLLEGLVFSRRIAAIIKEEFRKKRKKEKIKKGELKLHFEILRGKKNLDVKEARKELQKIMTKFVGVKRSRDSLVQALRKIEKFKSHLTSKMESVDDFELANMITVAELITTSSLAREESRGVHFREDFPYKDKAFRRHFLIKRKNERN